MSDRLELLVPLSAFLGLSDGAVSIMSLKLSSVAGSFGI